MTRSNFSEGAYWDDHGQRWKRFDEMVEPDQALEMVADGVQALVEWCDQVPVSESKDVMKSEVLPLLAGKAAYRKLMRKKTSKTVFVAEEWRNDFGDQLLILVEGPAAPRTEQWFY